MKIRVIHNFKDLEHKSVMRKQNQILEVSEERAKQIIGKGYAVKVDYIDLETKDEAQEPEVKEPEEVETKETDKKTSVKK